jgi:CubicO group peptidase (beta-lactamase class C family)
MALDDDVNQFSNNGGCRRTSSRSKKVTLRRILTHSAGLTVPKSRGYDRNSPPTLRQLLDGSAPANTSAIRADAVPGNDTPAAVIL